MTTQATDKLRRKSMMFATYEPAEHNRRPLSMSLIRRLLSFTRPHARLRNTLLAIVVLRSIQLPLLASALGAAIDGPIRAGDIPGTWRAAGIFAAMAIFTGIRPSMPPTLGSPPDNTTSVNSTTSAIKALL